MNAEEIKAYVAQHFRYEKQAALVAFEASDRLNWGGEPADVLVVTDRRFLYEIEVKISVADLKRDIHKRKHTYFKNSNDNHPVNRFFFAVPKEMTGAALDIIENTYPYAGLLIAKGGFIEHEKQAKLLSSNKLKFRQIYELTRQQSGTLCRLSLALNSSNNVAEERWQELLQLRKEVNLLKAMNATVVSQSPAPESDLEPKDHFLQLQQH
jgi:hypothetical protein